MFRYMKKRTILNIFNIFNLYLLIGIPYVCQAEDNFNLLAEDRKILEQLNILKRNNINNDNNVPSQPTVIKEETPPPPPTIQQPKATVVNIKKENTINIDRNSVANQKEKEIPTQNTNNVFPQKDIPVNVVTKTIEENAMQNNCIRENKQLEIANQKIKELSLELENKKRQLILVETEVERLSEVIEKRNRAELGQGTKPVEPNIVNQNSVAQRQLITIKKPLNELESEKADMPIVVVNVNKANLRVGPSLKHSTLLEVTKGTRLVVETRQEGWYRVMAPNGKRAWVSADVVDFGPTSNSKPSYTTRIKGYSPDVENRMESIYK